MIFRQTTKDDEAIEFANRFGYKEPMEKESLQGSILYPDNGQIIFRKMAGQLMNDTWVLGVVFLFRGFKSEAENGWAAFMADEISPKELKKALKKMTKIMNGMLKGTDRVTPEDFLK